MLYKTFSAAACGIDANIIEVEVDVSSRRTKIPSAPSGFRMQPSVRAADRVRSALPRRYDIPPTHITVNLAPADIRNEGSGFDLPMAQGILGAYGGLNQECVFVGEPSLDAGIRGIRGTLPIAIEARGKKLKRLVVPEVNAVRGCNALRRQSKDVQQRSNDFGTDPRTLRVGPRL